MQYVLLALILGALIGVAYLLVTGKRVDVTELATIAKLAVLAADAAIPGAAPEDKRQWVADELHRMGLFSRISSADIERAIDTAVLIEQLYRGIGDVA